MVVPGGGGLFLMSEVLLQLCLKSIWAHQFGEPELFSAQKSTKLLHMNDPAAEAASAADLISKHL